MKVLKFGGTSVGSTEAVKISGLLLKEKRKMINLCLSYVQHSQELPILYWKQLKKHYTTGLSKYSGWYRAASL